MRSLSAASHQRHGPLGFIHITVGIWGRLQLHHRCTRKSIPVPTMKYIQRIEALSAGGYLQVTVALVQTVDILIYVRFKVPDILAEPLYDNSPAFSSVYTHGAVVFAPVP